MAVKKPRKSVRVILGGKNDDSIRQVTQAENAEAVVISDDTVYKEPSVLYIGTGGSVAVRMIGGDQVTFVNVLDGSFLPILVDQVRSTGTTATNIVRLY